MLCLMEDQEEVVEEADEGELLVLRRALSNIKGDKEEQREHCSREGVLFDHKWRELCQHSFIKQGGEP